MWPTRHGEATLTQALRGQQSYDRPNTGKVGKVDIPQLQARASPQGPRTACRPLQPKPGPFSPDPSSNSAPRRPRAS
ncbi:hypothetical protein B296_00043305 [Ensete ventricosum]|uniref:Uncharacterized protein n=1 Tax=Ensete ventricosum TaxID=4639 RepID=A0A426YVN7_ENSVE|nr:hypothetical protein B296_00043305 [Ensete ventricosum]